MTFLQVYLSGFLLLFVIITLLWFFSLIIKDSSIVDIFWGAGFVIIGWFFFALTEGNPIRKLLLMAVVTIWGLRLCLFLAYRNIGQPEDFRYARWRKETGSAWWWQSFLRVFLLQATIMWFVSLPLLGAQYNDSPITILDFLALFVWLIGFIFEAVGDWQLQHFRANPQNKGRTLDTGLWRYTRHPNYFGDAVQWWAYYFFALSAGGWWTFIGAAIMTYLLMRVSGVAMLEKTLTKTKPQYAEYIRKTSAFFPRPPKP